MTLEKPHRELVFDTLFYSTLIGCTIKYNGVIALTVLTYVITVGFLVSLYITKENVDNSVFFTNCRDYFGYFLGGYILMAYAVTGAYVPSSSMRPTLTASEYLFIANAYQVKEPLTNTILFTINSPQVGDVVTFSYPLEPSKTFIKRIVAKQGDIIEYKNKTLTLNGQVVANQYQGTYTFLAENQHHTLTVDKYQETLNQVSHEIAVDSKKATYYRPLVDPKFIDQGYCQYFSNGFKCKVPKNKYFMMGDNRDNSSDSRYWGLVDIHQIKGKAIFSLISYDNQTFSFFKMIK